MNFLKNFTYNMPSIWIYDSSNQIWKYVIRFARWLNIDINDSAISNYREFLVQEVQQYNHDSAVDPMIIWLLIATAVMLLIKIRKLKFRQLKGIKTGYYLPSVFSFIIFCIILRWDPWVSRFMLTYLALLCSAIVVVIEWFMNNLREKVKVERGFLCIGGFSILVEVIGMFCYHSRIAYDNYEERTEGYFAKRTTDYETYKSITEYIEQKNIMNIGLVVSEDAYEYPLWKMIEYYNRIEHVNVDNDSGIYEDSRFVPDALLVINGKSDCNSIECHGYKYELTWWWDDNVRVYEWVQP